MKLNSIIEGLEYEISSNLLDIESLEINDIVYDSRKAKEKTIFVAIKGETVDGHNFIASAYEKGCRVFVVDEDVEINEDSIRIKVKDSRSALSKISANFFGNPSEKIKVIGVTGTKGKTTITNYIKTVLSESGMNTGVIGTNGVFYNDVKAKTINTTPESYELQKTIKEMLDAGVDCVAMEVSSSGLMMNRVNDIQFDIGIYTNLSPDHIGPKEHPTFEDYRHCKSLLFSLCKHGIVNVDDDNAFYIIDNAKCDISTFSIHKDSDLKAENIKLTRNEKILGVEFDYTYKDESKTHAKICSPGEFSIYNALAVISVCKHLGIDKERMLEALSNAKVDGRVEVLPVLPYATVVVDYAHNGMSLENVLNTLLMYKPKRMISLFGSIGGRCAIRRKELGDVAAKLCDITVITTDNPDNEDPMDIINDIAKSYENSSCQIYKIVDRAEAIYKALSIAEDGDMILITGKGHEKYQIINGERIFYDEKGEVIKAGERVRKEKGIEL